MIDPAAPDEEEDQVDFLNEPYCVCDCEPDEEEIASNRCKACGKEICP